MISNARCGPPAQHPSTIQPQGAFAEGEPSPESGLGWKRTGLVSRERQRGARTSGLERARDH